MAVIPVTSLDPVRDLDQGYMALPVASGQVGLERQVMMAARLALEVEEARDGSAVLQHPFGQTLREHIQRRWAGTPFAVVEPVQALVARQGAPPRRQARVGGGKSRRDEEAGRLIGGLQR